MRLSWLKSIAVTCPPVHLFPVHLSLYSFTHIHPFIQLSSVSRVPGSAPTRAVAMWCWITNRLFWIPEALSPSSRKRRFFNEVLGEKKIFEIFWYTTWWHLAIFLISSTIVQHSEVSCTQWYFCVTVDVHTQHHLSNFHLVYDYTEWSPLSFSCWMQGPLSFVLMQLGLDFTKPSVGVPTGTLLVWI